MLTALAYRHGLALLPAERRTGLHPPPRVVFAAGLCALAVALLSPLDAAASSLFSAHMLQHLVLMVIAAPLLASSHPVLVLRRALPPRWRRVVLRAARRSADLLAHPAVVWLVGTVVLWAWHLPSLYEAALVHHPLHALEHVTLLGTASAVWAVALGRGRRPVSTPVGVLLLFATSLQSSALGAVLTLARTPLYPIHDAGVRLWGLTLLEDQQLAGAMMWMPPGLIYLTVMAVLLTRWFSSLDARPSARETS
jgi:putative membrane protein